MALPYRAFDGWALPSPWGGDTSAAPGTSSDSLRSHFYSLSCRWRFGDRRLRSAACWRSSPSCSFTDRDRIFPDLKFPNLCNVEAWSHVWAGEESGLNAHSALWPHEFAGSPRPFVGSWANGVAPLQRSSILYLISSIKYRVDSYPPRKCSQMTGDIVHWVIIKWFPPETTSCWNVTFKPQLSVVSSTSYCFKGVTAPPPPGSSREGDVLKRRRWK